jgi:hypothetical protein
LKSSTNPYKTLSQPANVQKSITEKTKTSQPATGKRATPKTIYSHPLGLTHLKIIVKATYSETNKNSIPETPSSDRPEPSKSPTISEKEK